MTYVIFGSAGQLGTSCTKLFKDAVNYDHADVDITDHLAVQKVFDGLSKPIVINAAAFVNVEAAEDEIERAYKANTIGPLLLAKATEKVGGKLIHISTDYVFDGMKDSFIETDAPRPLNVYGLSKHAGEEAVAAFCHSHYILRTSALFGQRKEDAGNNFVTKRLEQMRQGVAINMVSDQWTVPTFTEDLSVCIKSLVEKEAPYGIYHGVNSGDSVTWFEFTQAIAHLIDTDIDVAPIETPSSGTGAKRPRKSVLRDTKLEKSGITMPDWKDALERYIHSIR